MRVFRVLTPSTRRAGPRRGDGGTWQVRLGLPPAPGVDGSAGGLFSMVSAAVQNRACRGRSFNLKGASSRFSSQQVFVHVLQSMAQDFLRMCTNHLRTAIEVLWSIFEPSFSHLSAGDPKYTVSAYFNWKHRFPSPSRQARIHKKMLVFKAIGSTYFRDFFLECNYFVEAAICVFATLCHFAYRFW